MLKEFYGAGGLAERKDWNEHSMSAQIRKHHGTRWEAESNTRMIYSPMGAERENETPRSWHQHHVSPRLPPRSHVSISPSSFHVVPF